MEKYIAFFDLDHTIIKSNSGRILIKKAYSDKLITPAQLLTGLYLSICYRLNLMETSAIIGKMVTWVEGISATTLNELSSEIFRKHISRLIRSEVKSEINFHKGNGGRVVMLSSALFPICKEVAYFLGIEEVICSELEIIDGICTGKLSGTICYGKEKETRLIKYCKDHHTDPSHSWYYSDSISDMPALNSVGNPVCINPDKKLKRAAVKRGWLIYHWH